MPSRGHQANSEARISVYEALAASRPHRIEYRWHRRLIEKLTLPRASQFGYSIPGSSDGRQSM